MDALPRGLRLRQRRQAGSYPQLQFFARYLRGLGRLDVQWPDLRPCRNQASPLIPCENKPSSLLTGTRSIHGWEHLCYLAAFPQRPVNRPPRIPRDLGLSFVV